MTSSAERTRASLLLRLQDAKDLAAWEEFVSLYSPVVRRTAIKRGLQAADADNIVQEVFLAVSASIGQWLDRSDRGSFRAWLLRIARNEAFDLIHERATRRIGKDGSEAEHLLATVSAEDDLSAALNREYAETLFHKATEQVRGSVAEHTWQAFWLTRVEGLSVEQAAKQLNLRPGNIYFARSRVMARIKELVEKYEAEDV
ncbi:MAG: RNA polymerase sigma factor [Planctomycetota bacterium]